MKAPKCYVCSGEKEVRHYSTQCPRAINTRPAINEERLTGAINSTKPRVKESRQAAVAEPHTRHDRVEPDVGSKTVPLLSRTPNRRNREDYNAYMKEYMARRRSG